jgi:putative redox protein
LRLDGSGETGQSMVDGVLSALAACTGVDVVEILGKRRTPVERFAIDATGERAATVPRRLVRIRLDYRIDGPGIDREQAERAVELAITRYCSVRDSLDRAIPIGWTVVLNGEAGEERVG